MQFIHRINFNDGCIDIVNTTSGLTSWLNVGTRVYTKPKDFQKKWKDPYNACLLTKILLAIKMSNPYGGFCFYFKCIAAFFPTCYNFI